MNIYKLFNYLKNENIILEPSTIRKVESIGEIPMELFPYFHFGTKIINFILKEPSIYVYRKDCYNFIKRNYGIMPDEEIIKYLGMAYDNPNILKLVMDPLMPKITGRKDYLKIISKKGGTYNQNLAAKFLSHPVFRRDKDYLNLTRFDVYNAYARLENMCQIWDEAIISNKEEIAQEVSMVQVKNQQLLNKVVKVLTDYEDFAFLRFIIKMNLLDNYSNLFSILIKVKDVDEYTIFKHHLQNYFYLVLFMDNYSQMKKTLIADLDADRMKAKEGGFINIYLLLDELEKVLMDKTLVLKK